MATPSCSRSRPTASDWCTSVRARCTRPSSGSSSTDISGRSDRGWILTSMTQDASTIALPLPGAPLRRQRPNGLLISSVWRGRNGLSMRLQRVRDHDQSPNRCTRLVVNIDLLAHSSGIPVLVQTRVRRFVIQLFATRFAILERWGLAGLAKLWMRTFVDVVLSFLRLRQRAAKRNVQARVWSDDCLLSALTGV